MKRIMKKLVSFCLLCTVLSSIMVPVSAAERFMNISSGYKSYVTCTLANRRKPGYVNIWVTGNSFRWGYTQRNSVRLTTTRGSYIWEERGAIPMNGSRTFYLGNDHSAYRVYVKTYYGYAGATLSGRGNVNLSSVHK